MQTTKKSLDGGQLPESTTLLNQLKSSYWHDRYDALNQIMLSDNPTLLKSAGEYIQDSNDEFIIVSFIKTSKLNIENERMDICTPILYYQFYFQQTKIEKIKVECEKNIELFFASQKLVGAFKIECLRLCFKLLPDNKRIYITKLIGARKLKPLAPLFITNFFSNNEDLILSTLRSCIFLKSTSNKIHVKKIINTYLPNSSEDETILSQSLLTLGYIGSWFDQFLIKSYFINPSSTVQALAIRSYRVLLKENCIPKLLKEFYSNTNINVRKAIIIQLGKIDHPKSAQALLDLYIQSKKLDVQKQLSWSFHELSNKNKIPSLIKCFLKRDDKTRFKLMKFFNEIYDWKCYDFLVAIIHGKYNRFITMAAIEYISTYNKVETMEYIKSKYTGHDDPLAYYYLSSVLNHQCVNAHDYILEHLALGSQENLMIFSLLLNKILEFRHQFNQEQAIFDFILSGLKREGNLCQLAYKVAMQIHNEDIFNYLWESLQHFDPNLNKTNLRQLCSLIIHLIQHNPSYIKNNAEILIHPDILNFTRERDITSEFVRYFLEIPDVHEILAPYLSKFEIKFTPILFPRLLGADDFKLLYKILPVLVASKMHFSQNFMQYLIETIFPSAPESIQCMILDIILNQKGQIYFEFLLRTCITGSNLSDKSKYQTYISKYINSI